MSELRKFIAILIALMGLVIIGTIGYIKLLDVSFIDGLYMTIITISTVGYSEVAEMTFAAKIFSIFVILSGLSLAGYIFTSIASLLFDGELKNAWRRKKMDSKIAALTNHYILCGAGETGYSVINQFMKVKAPFVVIEKDEEKVQELVEQGICVIHGDATHEDALEKANIYLAKGLVSSLSKDANNVFAVLTARQMNPNLYIVARAIEKNASEKLLKAGANNTISPNEIGGKRMAMLLMRPSIISFLDVITFAGDVVLDLEEVIISKHSELIDMNLREARLPKRTGLVVLAIKKHSSDSFIFNPNGDEVLRLGDKKVVLGKEEQIAHLRAIAKDDEAKREDEIDEYNEL